MPSLKEVRTRINSVKSTQQITKAMKMVAAAKLRKAQDAITQMRPYAKMLGDILQNLTASTAADDLSSVFAENRKVENVVVVVITSDRGLCGGFNNNAIKQAIALSETSYAEQFNAGKGKFLCIGTKGYDALRKRGYTVISDYAETFHHLSFDKVKEAGDFLLDSFAKGEIDKVEIVYNEFKNVATQILRAENFLPIAPPDNVEGEENSSTSDYILEPSKEEIIEELIPKSLKIQLYRAVLESNAAEQGARMTSMDKATENAGELLKELQLVYNRSRQAAITKEILEIVGGAEALQAG